MAGRSADFGAPAAGVFFLAAAAFYLYTAFSGEEVLPFAYQAAALVAGYALVSLVRGLLRPRGRKPVRRTGEG